MESSLSRSGSIALNEKKTNKVKEFTMPLKSEELEYRKPDSQGRIVIGKQHSNETFMVSPQTNGDILLRPVVVMPKQEAWLFANQDAMASVRLGLEQSKARELHDLGSFAEHASDEDDDNSEE